MSFMRRPRTLRALHAVHAHMCFVRYNGGHMSLDLNHQNDQTNSKDIQKVPVNVKTVLRRRYRPGVMVWAAISCHNDR